MFRNILKVLIGLMVLVGVVFVSCFILYFLGDAISHFLEIEVKYPTLLLRILLGLLGFLALCFAFVVITLCKLIGELILGFFERR